MDPLSTASNTSALEKSDENKTQMEAMQQHIVEQALKRRKKRKPPVAQPVPQTTMEKVAGGLNDFYMNHIEQPLDNATQPLQDAYGSVSGAMGSAYDALKGTLGPAPRGPGSPGSPPEPGGPPMSAGAPRGPGSPGSPPEPMAQQLPPRGPGSPGSPPEPGGPPEPQGQAGPPPQADSGVGQQIMEMLSGANKSMTGGVQSGLNAISPSLGEGYGNMPGWAQTAAPLAAGGLGAYGLYRALAGDDDEEKKERAYDAKYASLQGVEKDAGYWTEAAGNLNPINLYGGSALGGLAALFTPTRDIREQAQADQSTWQNMLIPGVGGYNAMKRLGHSIRGPEITEEREELAFEQDEEKRQRAEARRAKLQSRQQPAEEKAASDTYQTFIDAGASPYCAGLMAGCAGRTEDEVCDVLLKVASVDPRAADEIGQFIEQFA